MELQPFREENAKNNLYILAKDATRRSSESKVKNMDTLTHTIFYSFLFWYFANLKTVMFDKSGFS
jgi:hypothetical protein